MRRGLFRLLAPPMAVLVVALMLPVFRAAAAPAPPAAVAATASQPPQCVVPGISQLCSVASQPPIPALTNPLGSLTSGIADDIATSITKWVVRSAADLLGDIASVIRQNTAPDLSSQWFVDNYRLMIEVMLPSMLFCVVIVAIKAALTGNPGAAGDVVGYLPVAFFATFAAIPAIDTLLKVIDEISSPFAATVSDSFTAFASNVGNTLGDGATNCTQGGHCTIVGGLFTALIAGVFIVIGSLLLFLMLLLREGIIYSIAIFIPISMAWVLLGGILERITKTSTDILIVAILSKFLIVVVLALFAAGFKSNASHDGLISVLLGVAAIGTAVYLPLKLLGSLPGMRLAMGAMLLSRTGGAALMAAPASAGHVYAGVRNANLMRGGLTGAARMAGGTAAGATAAGGAVGSVPLLGAREAGVAAKVGSMSRVAAGGLPTGLAAAGSGGVRASGAAAAAGAGAQRATAAASAALGARRPAIPPLNPVGPVSDV